MKVKRPMGKMGKVRGPRRPALRKGPKRLGPRPPRKSFKGGPRPAYGSSGGCFSILAGLVIITSLFIII